jgi:hypothetical protein
VSELHSHPSAAELLDVAIAYLAESIRPTVPDDQAYLFRVTLNALGVVARELRSAPADDAGHRERLAALGFTDDADLAEALRSGRVDDAELPRVQAALLADAEARVRVAAPGYLERY